jgi:hypothetical protein
MGLFDNDDEPNQSVMPPAAVPQPNQSLVGQRPPVAKPFYPTPTGAPVPQQPLVQQPLVQQPVVPQTVTTTVSEPTKEEKALYEAQDKIRKQQLQNVQFAAEEASIAADVQVAKAKAQENAFLDYQVDLEAEREQFQEKYNAASTSLAEQEKIFKNMKVKDFYEDKSVGTKIMAALAVGLGAYSSGMIGGPNHALKIISSAIEDDHKKQLARISHQERVVEKAGKLTGQVKDQFTFAKLMLDNKKAVAFDIAANTASEQLARVGVSKADTKGQEMILALQQEGLKQKQKVQESLRTKIVTATQVAKNADGKIVGSQAAKDIGELDAADDLIKDLWADWEKNASQPFSGIESLMPWSKSVDKYEASRKQKAQMIGGIMEGGKLTDMDYERYLNMMPTPWDTKKQAKNKIKELADTLRLKRKGVISGLSSAGYNTSGFPESAAGAKDVKEVIRTTKDGRKAVFNAETKEFIRYE